MNTDGMRTSAWRFDRFTLDNNRGALLTASGAEVPLRPKSMALLRLLVENAGRLLERATIMAALWPDVVVGDESITQCVRDVRLALGDHGRLLRTVPKRGYLFAAAVAPSWLDRAAPPLTPPPSMASPSAGASALPDRPSIAVLPFQNLSGNTEQDHFADGMVEDITTALSQLRWLFVIACNASFTCRGRMIDPRQVGRELGARYVLEGSVRSSGSRMRITAQLIDAATGAHLWAGRFDGDRADIFELQDQVTARVVGALSPRLEQAEIERAKHKPTGTQDAYDCFLRGMDALHRFTRAGNAAAPALFARAIALDPDYASAYGMAARCYLQRKAFGWVSDRERETAEAERLARRAAALGRDDAVALGAAGGALVTVVGALDDGAALVERSLVLNPNLAWVLHDSAFIRAFLGEPAAALEQAGLAMRLSPHDPHLFGMQAATALALLLIGRYDEASSWAATAVRQQPHFVVASCIAAAGAALAGRRHDAAVALERVRQLDPALRLTNLKDLLPFHRPEDFARWRDGLSRAGLSE